VLRKSSKIKYLVKLTILGNFILKKPEGVKPEQDSIFCSIDVVLFSSLPLMQ
jgi:hypothetical protein